MARLAPIALLCLALAVGSAACGGDGDGEVAPEPVPTATETTTVDAETNGTETEPEPEPEADEPAARPLRGLPGWTAGFREWPKLNDEQIEPVDFDPHFGWKDVYASEAIRGGAYPPGTVIVKEATEPGQDFVRLVAAMRKVPGANPAHNDWVFVEWTRDAADEPFSEFARGDVCASCHSGVAGQDYVFTQP